MQANNVAPKSTNESRAHFSPKPAQGRGDPWWRSMWQGQGCRGSRVIEENVHPPCRHTS